MTEEEEKYKKKCSKKVTKAYYNLDVQNDEDRAKLQGLLIAFCELMPKKEKVPEPTESALSAANPNQVNFEVPVVMQPQPQPIYVQPMLVIQQP